MSPSADRLRIGGYRFYFFSHEPNEPSHIHGDRGDASLKAWLLSVGLARNRGFRQREINVILAMVEQHRAVLLGAWDEYFGPDRG